MFERFTERARQVVVLAQQASRKERVGYIGCEQLLLGLLGEEEGLASRALTHLGVTLDKATVSVNGRISGRLREDQELAGQIPFTPRAKSALEKALREALSLGHNYIGTEHVLLGLMREGENVAVEILRDDFNLTPEAVREEVVRMLSGPGARGVRREKGGSKTLENGMKLYDPRELERIVDIAITLGRQHPDLPTANVLLAAKALAKSA